MRTIQQLIATHRALVVENEALYDANGKPKNKAKTRAHDRVCDDALVAVMEAPCRSVADVEAKLAHMLDTTLRERGPIYLDAMQELDLVACSGDPENALFAVFMRSLRIPTLALVQAA